MSLRSAHKAVWAFVGVSLAIAFSSQAAELKVNSPREWQVIQRQADGLGLLRIGGEKPAGTTLEWRCLDVKGGEWQSLETKGEETAFTAGIQLPAGGWYQIELRARAADRIFAETRISHVGVGEVFVVAGQSNAGNHGSGRHQSQTGKVTSFDGKSWSPCADPQPGASGDAGSFLPAFGDALARALGVPVGLAAVAQGATSVREWLPQGEPVSKLTTTGAGLREVSPGVYASNGALFERLASRLDALGHSGCRAVLWHQGESDAGQVRSGYPAERQISGDEYFAYMRNLILATRARAGWPVPWVTALATYHSETDPADEEFRSAQKRVWEAGLAWAGPDTDALRGEWREEVHFNAKGLQKHGEVWAEKILAALAQSASGPVKVFVLVGQSNMEGQAVADLDGPDYNGGNGTLRSLLQDPARRDRFAHLIDSQGNWTVRQDVWVWYQPEEQPLKAGPLTLGFTPYGGRHHFGPELQFGHVLGDFLTNQVLLIKTAWGGKSLFADFRPPSSGGQVGPYYRKMIAGVKEALSNLPAGFPGSQKPKLELAGMVWYQGWNDGCDPRHAVPEYEQNLVNFIRDVRKDLDAPGLPIVIGELTGPWVEAPGEWATLRKAQAAAAHPPDFKGNVVFVPTHDFVRTPENSPNPTHGHHEYGNAETYFLVGDALGQAMLRLLGATDFLKP